MNSKLDERRESTSRKIAMLQAELQPASNIVDGKACVYATGSFARLEASQHSDLDLFIVGNTDSRSKTRLLIRLDEIRLKAALIEVTRKLGIPDFSGDGQYLVHYAVSELVESLGRPEDDATNTFTARLLLLLESKPILGGGVYDHAVREVIDSYWRDFSGHEEEFVPAFLTNDILRLWRTFCVNYEARSASDTDEKRAKRRLKNFKLKHSRLLTCFSAIAWMLALEKSKPSITPPDIESLVRLTPTQRLTSLCDLSSVPDVRPDVDRILDLYAWFLEETNKDETALVHTFADDVRRRDLSEKAHEFGGRVHDLLLKIGEGTRLLRLLVV